MLEAEITNKQNDSKNGCQRIGQDLRNYQSNGNSLDNSHCTD